VLRDVTANWLTGGLHVLIVVIAAQADSSDVWPYALAAMSFVSFFAWIGNYRRYRLIHDVPTSKVASAAQGYVEFFGKAAQIPNWPIKSPLSGLPCCWYRYCVERKNSKNEWKTEDSGKSVAHFLLVDETGECVISPDGAEVMCPQKSTWTRGDRRYTEWLVLPQRPLYVLGEFRTASGADLELNQNQDVSHLLGDWKKDQKTLLSRFDTDRDGILNLKEWEAARLEARRAVEQQHAELRAGEGVHLLAKPRDGRVFLIAPELPDTIGRRFAFWSLLHLAFFFGAGTAAFLLLVSAARSAPVLSL
jgi:hypothetical protein